MEYVYKLTKDGELIDFGKTNNVKRRANERKLEGNLTVLSCWPTKHEALLEEGRLKTEHGMEWTERIGRTACRHTTYELANEIKSKYIPRKYTQGMLAKDYNLSRKVIRGIVEGRTYLEP